MSERIVVVGAGLAGHRVVTALRSGGFGGDLTVIGEEVHAPYNRPPLSKAFLAGGLDRERLSFRAPEDVDWRLGTAATGLDLAAHEVSVAGGEPVGYDKLVIATGRRARPWPGPQPRTGVHTLRTVDDSLALRSAVSPTTKVAIVGAGFIGSEAAATLHGLGVESISLIDVVEHPITPLGAEIGARVAQAHHDHGIELHLGQGVAALRGADSVEGVELADGAVIDADVVLLALGALPNTEWLEGTGLQLHRGAVVVDATLFAPGHDDIAAVGDVAAWPDPHGEDPLSVEHWNNAQDMAKLLAANLVLPVGERTPYTGLPSFWSDIFELKIKSVGRVAGADRLEIVEDVPEEHALIAESFAGDALVGVVTINRNRQAIEYTQRLQSARSAI